MEKIQRLRLPRATAAVVLHLTRKIKGFKIPFSFSESPIIRSEVTKVLAFSRPTIRVLSNYFQRPLLRDGHAPQFRVAPLDLFPEVTRNPLEEEPRLLIHHIIITKRGT